METPICSVHNSPMKERTGQYGKFWSCPTKLPDGSWCKAKPNQPPAPTLKPSLSGIEFKEIIAYLSRIENMLKDMYVPVSKPKISVNYDAINQELEEAKEQPPF